SSDLRTSCLDDDIFWCSGFLYRTDDLWLSRKSQLRGCKSLVHVGIPGSFRFCDGTRIFFGDAESLQGIDKLCECFACIGDDWKLRTVLVGIERRDVDVDELHVWVLERGARCGGEVAVAGTNTDNDICLKIGRASCREGETMSDAVL